MSIYDRPSEVWCDARGCEVMEQVSDANNLRDSEIEARLTKRHGWKRVGENFLCPDCVAELAEAR